MRRTHFVTRSSAELREAAAKVCERMAKTPKAVLPTLDTRNALLEAAKRIRRLPLAGYLGKKA